MKDLRKLLEPKNNLVQFRWEEEFYRCDECNFMHFDKDLNHTPDSDYDIMVIKNPYDKILYDRNTPVNNYEVDLI